MKGMSNDSQSPSRERYQGRIQAGEVGTVHLGYRYTCIPDEQPGRDGKETRAVITTPIIILQNQRRSRSTRKWEI